MTIPDGYVLVPIEPTQEMIAAGNSVEPRVHLIWDAMLKAAPQIAAQQLPKQDVLREDDPELLDEED